jgi:GH24 family phage-related lysozyme (muramidase)
MGECYCNQEQHQSESLKRFKASYQSSVDRYGQVKLAEAVNSVVLDAR